jgi:replication initiation and membrane attachment protein DnaB
MEPGYSPSQTERVGKLEVLELLEIVAPKNKFSGKANEMNFERFMERMKQAMDAEGVTDDLRVRCIDNWFSGRALQIVQSKINHGIDAATTLSDIEESLKHHFGSEEFDVEGMLKKLAKEKPIAKGSLEDVEALIIDLECQFDLARGKGEEVIFEQNSIYRDILSARLPHLITRWSEEFGGGKKKWTFKAFTEFVFREARIDD